MAHETFGFGLPGTPPSRSGLSQETGTRADGVYYEEFWGDDNAPLWVVLTEAPVPEFARFFATLLKRISRTQSSGVRVACAVKYTLPVGQVSEVSKWFAKHAVRLSETCPVNSKVLTFGRALFSITRGDDLMPGDFLDHITNPIKFYAPDLGCWVWPLLPLETYFVPDARVGGWRSLFSRHVQHLLTKLKMAAADMTPPLISPTPFIKVVPPDEVPAFLRAHDAEPLVAFDLETSSLDPESGEVGCLTLAFSPQGGYYLDQEALNKHAHAIHEFLSRRKLIGQNVKFDLRFLRRHYGMTDLRAAGDTWALGHVLNETRGNSLKALSWWYSPFGGYEEPLVRYKEASGVKNYLEIPRALLTHYAVMDVVVTQWIHQEMQKQLDWVDATFPLDARNSPVNHLWSLRRYYEDIVVPAINLYTRIEEGGIYVNPEKLESQADVVRRTVLALRDELKEELGANPDSTKELGAALTRLGWPKIKLTDTGQMATDDATLTKYARAGYPLATKLQKYRTWSVALKTFLGGVDPSNPSGWPKHLRRHPDGSTRMHPTFSVMGADSGRDKCSQPNLQQVPARGEISSVVKSPLCPPNPDWVFLSVDFSSLQIRLAGIESQDPMLREIYTKHGGDVHSLTAFLVFCKGRTFPEDTYVVEQDGVEYGPYRTGDKVTVLRRGARVTVRVEEVEESDTFLPPEKA